MLPPHPPLSQGNRSEILACGDDGLAAYATLKSMRFLQPGQPSADELAREAAALYQAVPPAVLVRRYGIQLQQSAAVHAYLAGGRWHVPAEPPRPRRQRGKEAVQQFQALMAPRQASARLLLLLFRHPQHRFSWVRNGCSCVMLDDVPCPAVLLSREQPSWRLR
jgi:hypothetical protein